MDMKEFYNAVGGDYTDVCERFMNEKIVGVFIEKFLQDSTFAEMADMLEHDSLPEAFRTAHTLKGICANLGFKNLADVSSEITELLRSGDIESAKKLFAKSKQEYYNVLDSIEKLRSAQKT